MRKMCFFMVAVVFCLGIMVSGCASAGVMPAETRAADDTTATVYFMMPGSGVTMSGFGSLTVGTQFSLWKDDTFLSNIGGKEYVVFHFEEGTHFFTASGENYYTVQAELAAGKSYYIELITLPGFNRPNVGVKSLNPEDPEIENYLKNSKEIKPKGKVTDSMVKKVGETLSNAKAGSQNIDIISADRGR